MKSQNDAQADAPSLGARACGDCQDAAGSAPTQYLGRREFLSRSAGAGLALATGVGLWTPSRSLAQPTPASSAETAVKALYESLTPAQTKEIAFSWDHKDPKRGLLRTYVSNNWQITKPAIKSGFYTKKQQDLIHEVFKGLVSPEWYDKFLKQLKEDTGGKAWGNEQSIALFGKPGEGKFEFVMTGRHMTLRADGNTEDHMAFGGPIFYGHAGQNFNEKPHHPGNVFWHQAVMANKVFGMIDPAQQKKALVEVQPPESEVDFKGPKGNFTGIAVKELASEQKTELATVLKGLLEPFRKDDRDEALACLQKQGGLDQCYLTFYKEGALVDGEWDNWRLEGPSFVWYFRGTPHVHVWVNIADAPTVKLNAQG